MAFALPADIALGTRAQQVVTAELPAIKARYPNQARDASIDSPQGYFDTVVDAQTVVNARAALLGVERRRFAVEVDGLIWYDPLTYAGVRLVDDEQSVDLVCLVARWEVDCEAERTRFELMG
jgi:hypothetical protein